MPPSPAETDAGTRGEAPAPADAATLTAEAHELLHAGQPSEAVKRATRATALEDASDATWLVLAQAFEAQGELPAAFGAYSQGLALASDPTEISGAMGRLALRLGQFAKAEALLTTHLERAPRTADAVAGLARAQTKVLAFDRAHETLKTALEADPGQAVLWLTLAELLNVEGRHGQSPVFFQEALRLDPTCAPAWDGLAEAQLVGAGDVDQALASGERALAAATPDQLPALTAAHARRLLAAGRLAEGWTTFAEGMGSGPAAQLEVRMAAPRWAPGAARKGRLALIGEQSLFDELLLTQAVPDLIAEGAPLLLAVAPRWETLARRSFPEAQVVSHISRTLAGRLQVTAVLDSPHVHGGELVAAWAPLRSMMTARRSAPGDFAGARPYLKPDGERVAYWRNRLAPLGGGPKVGVVWRPLARDGAKEWEAPPLQSLISALAQPGLTLIAAQQGEVLNETDWIRGTFGLEVYDPPPELRRDDLDDLAALLSALDVVVGPPGAATCIAAACGAPTWLLSTPHHWARLGSEAYPWFPAARVISAAGPGDWDAAMAELAEALAGLAAR